MTTEAIAGIFVFLRSFRSLSPLFVCALLPIESNGMHMDPYGPLESSEKDEQMITIINENHTILNIG